MKSSVIQVNFTSGFGNNLFQYIYSRLLSEKYGGIVSVNLNRGAKYATSEFKKVGIKLKQYPFSGRSRIKVIDKNAASVLSEDRYKNHDFIVNGYFEDYQLYTKYIDQIRSWFLPIEKGNTDDLVFHLRLGEKLLIESTYSEETYVSPSQYIRAIEQFDFKHLYIVTDMRSWNSLDGRTLLNMRFFGDSVSGSDLLGTPGYLTSPDKGVEYFNSIFKVLNELDPVIVRCEEKVSDDFNFIRSFDKILFQHGTTAWWAAALGSPSKVGVYGPWRPSKGARNKNLSQVDLPGWFKWF